MKLTKLSLLALVLDQSVSLKLGEQNGVDVDEAVQSTLDTTAAITAQDNAVLLLAET